MKHCYVVKFLFITLSAICFVAANSSFVYANARPAKTVEDANILLQAAKEAVSAINETKITTETELEISKNKITVQRAKICDLITSINETLDEIIKSKTRTDRRSILSAKLSELRAKEAKLTEENRAIEDAMRAAEDKAETAMNQATALLVIGVIGASLQSASATISFIEQNDRAGLSNFLARDVPSTSLEVKEMTKDNGINFKIIIGKTIYCLSTKRQCGGKSFSIIR